MATALTTPPRAIEPVSPINDFAGYAFILKKPKQAPVTASANIASEI